MCFLSHTSLTKPSFSPRIVALLTAANGNLLVTFANELREQGWDAMPAAIEAARIRLRPVVMTALAMILGMLPMAFALGEGGEQNAPLGRAVIGGLLAATATTLFVVPTVYAIVGRRLAPKHVRDEAVDAAAARLGHVSH